MAGIVVDWGVEALDLCGPVPDLVQGVIERAVRFFGHPHLEIAFNEATMSWGIREKRGIIVVRDGSNLA